ncbi:MAG: beta strand repeat-containing protein [Limisphaerales bacterium]
MKPEIASKPKSPNSMKTIHPQPPTNALPFTNILNKLHRQIPAALVLVAAFALTQLAGAASYTWTNSVGNWSTPANWSPNTGAGGPLGTDTVIFDNTASSYSGSQATVNNTVDAYFTVMNLTNGSYSGGSSYTIYHVTQIPYGETLTVTDNMFIGGQNLGAASPTTDPYATYAYLVGGGTLNVTAPSLTIQNYGSAAGANPCAYLDLSGLTNFVYSNTNGAIDMAGFVPANYASGSRGTRQAGSLILAGASNIITVSAINLGTSGVAQGGPSGSLASGIANQLTLGPGINIINATTFNISAQKNTFAVASADSGDLRIRGITGADSDANVNIILGNKNVSGGSGSITGNLLLNGCAVDIKANALIVGDNTGGQPNSSGDSGNGVLQFDTGTISANSMTMGLNTSPNNGAGIASCSGIIQVGANGTLLIGAGQLFALATAASTGPSTGTLIVSNGLVNCQGPITMGVSSVTTPGNGTATGTIDLIGAGTLSMGPNSYIGVISNPVTSLILDTNSVLSISIPSASYTNICVQNLGWPLDDTGLTISVAAIPANITNNEAFPLLNFSGTMTNTFNNPKLALPLGVTGYLSLAPGDNTIYMTITSGAGPGKGGVDYLLNPYFISGSTNWTATGSGASIVSTNSTYPNTGGCTVDTRNIVPLPGTGGNVAKLTGSFIAGGSTNTWSQSASITAGSQVTLGCSTYVAHEDIVSGADSFYYEVDFLDTNGTLIAAYESSVLSNLDCGSPILDTWTDMPLTNQMQVVGGVNTGVVISNVPPVFQVPPQTVTARFKAVFIQRNATDTGSVYFSGANIGFLLAPVPPTVSSITPNLITLCTNQFLTCIATSSITAISGVQVTATTTTLAGSVLNTAIYTNGSTGLTITGLGTSSANISLTLATNTIYQSVVVKATDADGLTVSSSPVSFDTLTPVLVIEASDFNFSNGGFLNTPANGGLAMFTNQIGVQGIDEFTNALRTATRSYYRTNDGIIIQNADPELGTPPSAIEQKFITAAANGDTVDVEQEVGYNSAGNWANYTRTFGNDPTNSAPPGTYNVWGYVAAVGNAGVLTSLSQVTSDPTQPNQTTSFLGNFGTASFGDTSYNTYVYTPLVDQFGNLARVTIGSGAQTFRSTIIGNPNLGFYMLMPVVPILTPVLLQFYPNGPLEPTNALTFSVGPAEGASISTNGIGLIINGAPINSGLSFMSLGGGAWTVTYPILSNTEYTVIINVTNLNGLTASYTNSFDTFNINNFHWMAADYDFSTNNGTASGGSVGDGWTGDLFIDNPIPTGDTNTPINTAFWQLQTNSYFGYPTGFGPSFGPLGGDTLAGLGAVAHQGVDINWLTNATQDTGGVISNSIYRFSSVYVGGAAEVNGGDGVGTQIASDSFLLPEFIFAQTNNASGSPDPAICEFNVGYFYTNDWLNYTRTFPTGTFNVWGRLAAGGGAFNGYTLSLVTSGVGTSNQTTQVLGSFSDSSPAGWQSYHWVQLLDTNGNPVYVQLNGKATLRLTAPTNATPSGGGLNPLFFMLAPAVPPALAFNLTAVLVGGQVQISIPTQVGYTYQLWQSSSLSPANWTQVGGSIVGDDTVHVINQSPTGRQDFYRVSAE